MQVIVLGMHRSGTSAVARLINMMGASVGDPSEIGRSAADNKKGFWELRPVSELNDRMLASTNCSWDDPVGFDSGLVSEDERSEITTLVRELLFQLDATRPWVVKDPRLSFTLPLWRPLLESPLVVIPFRHPISVAESLLRRNGIPLSVGTALWEQYLSSALHNTATVPRYLMNFDSLIEEPVQAVGRLLKWLSDNGTSGLRMPSAGEIRAFVEPGLRHHKAPSTDSVGCENAVALFEGLKADDGLPESWEPAADAASLLGWVHTARTGEAGSRVRPDSVKPATGGASHELAHGEKSQANHSLWRSVEETEVNAKAALVDSARALERIDVVKQELEDLRCRIEKAEVDEPVENPLVLRSLESAALSRDAVLWQCHDELETLQMEYRRLHSRLDQVRELAHLTSDSMRWRIGNRLCRVAELLLLRPKPDLAMRRMLRVTSETSFGRSSVQPLLRQIRALVDGGPISRTKGWTNGEPKVDVDSAGRAVRSARPGSLNFIIFPVIDWHFRIQRPQHLARELANQGHRVFYLGTVAEAGASCNGHEIIEEVEQNIYLVKLITSLDVSPNIYTDRPTQRQLKCLSQAVGDLVDVNEIANVVAMVDAPFWGPLATSLTDALVIYDCMDHHAGFGNVEKVILGLEQKLIKSADLVVVTSDWLAKEIGRQRDVVTIRNGADTAHFRDASERRSSRQGKRPVVGYIGAIAEWFDLELIRQLAMNMPDADFHLVGAVTGVDIDEVSALPNVTFTGEVSYRDAPRQVHEFDVALIPFLLCDLTSATNPVKAYEYLAAGKPVVAVPLPELRRMGGEVVLATGADEFEQSIRKAIETDSSEMALRRVAWAAGHDWAARAEQLLSAVRRYLPKVSIVVLTWNNLAFTKACLHSITEHTRYPNYEILVVDNGSTDGTREYLDRLVADDLGFRVIFNEDNLGFAGGNNVGIKAADGDFIALLNNDTFVSPGWLLALVSQLQQEPKLGMVGPVTNNIGNEARIDIDYGDMEEMVVRACEYTSAHKGQRLAMDTLAFFCCVMRATVVDSIGYLDEQFERGFFEDDDFCRRLAEAGYGLAVAEDAFVHHHLSASFSMLDQGERDRLFVSNKKRYEAKWGKWRPHEYRKTSG